MIGAETADLVALMMADDLPDVLERGKQRVVK